MVVVVVVVVGRWWVFKKREREEKSIHLLVKFRRKINSKGLVWLIDCGLVGKLLDCDVNREEERSWCSG